MADDFRGSDALGTAEDYVTASSAYACARGTSGMLALRFPKGQTIRGPLSVGGESVVIQGRSHYVDASGSLVTE